MEKDIQYTKLLKQQIETYGKEKRFLESVLVFAFSSALRIFADFSAQPMIARMVSAFRSK